jgi:hypothetical protein
VVYLKFGPDFNQPIENNIPPLVTHLKLSYNFNQSIQNFIPLSVTHLTLGHDFKHPFTNYILSVTHLTLNCSEGIYDMIPPSVTHLKFGHRFDHHININKIPPTVICLIFNNKLSCFRILKTVYKLLSSIKIIMLHECMKRYISYDIKKKINVIFYEYRKDIKWINVLNIFDN